MIKFWVWGVKLKMKFIDRFILVLILTNDKLESARTGNWFAENSMAICRLDKLSRCVDLDILAFHLFEGTENKAGRAETHKASPDSINVQFVWVNPMIVGVRNLMDRNHAESCDGSVNGG